MLEKAIKLEGIAQNLHGKFAKIRSILFAETIAHIVWILILSSYDTERKVWQELKSMPIRMSGQFPIELNGSIYVVERNMLAKNLLAFWCYEPTKDEWKEKAGFHIGDDFPHIFKMKQNLCTFSKKGGFKIYDAAMNRWNTVIH